MRKSSSASRPSSPGALPPTVAVTFGRAGRPMRHDAGMRTITPAALERRHVLEELQGLLRAPAQRVIDRAGGDHSFSQATRSAAR